MPIMMIIRVNEDQTKRSRRTRRTIRTMRVHMDQAAQTRRTS